ncbi:MAG: hypothetical protein AAFX57_07920, partial [Bacteroidota bacterium]
MNSIKKKSPWKGCLTYLTLTVPAYFFTSWQVATSIAVLITALMIMYGGIEHEIKKIRKLKNTPRTVISAAPSFGYVKLKAKIKPSIPNIMTYLSHEPAGYRWLSIQYMDTQEKREADATIRYESDWISLYDEETNLKTFEISDGTGSCLVGLHHTHYYINYKKKELTPVQLLEFVKKESLQNVPLERIKKDKKFQVVERWIKKDQPITIYGTMNKLSLGHPPPDLIKAAGKALKYGADDDTRKRDPQRLLTKEDWQTLIDQAK